MATDRTRRIRGTRGNVGCLIGRDWLRATDFDCEALNFGDLDVNEKFIPLPSPGDNSGHGGLLGGAWLFMKIEPESFPVAEIPLNAVCLTDGCKVHFSDADLIYLVNC